MRTKKAVKNIISSLIYQIVSIVCGLIAPRLILTAYGSTYNGVVSSATHLLGMISILTLGIAGATRVALYKSLAANDILATSRIMKSNKRYMRRVAVVLAAYAVVLMIVYPYISHNDLAKNEVALLIGIVSISSIAEYFFGISNVTLLSAAQSGYLASTISIIARIANTTIIFLLVRSGASVFVVYLASSLVFFISPAVLNYIVRRRFGLIRDCEPDDSALKQRGAAAFHSVANIVHNNTDLVLLTAFMDAKVISVYTVYYLVVGKIKSLMSVFTGGMEGAFGDMWAKKEYNNFNRNFEIYEYALYSFTAVAFTCVGLLILPFLSRYTAGITDIEYLRPSLAVFITLAEAMHCVRQPYLTIVQATGNYEATKIGALMEAVVNLAVSVILIQLIGINGVIIGTLVANTIRTAQFSVFASKHLLHRSITAVFQRFAWLLANSGTIIGVSFLLIRRLSFAPGWMGWIVEAVIVTFIACAVTVLYSLAFYKRDLRGLTTKLLNAGLFRKKRNRAGE